MEEPIAPPSLHWRPEDDVLLKNAVEAGASLESLAKGAVKFSQRFTLQEIQDRWYSLLYDPVISEQAATLMIAIENPISFNQPKNVKSIPCSSGKRKSESIRNCYYQMHKRLMMDTHFLSGPSHFNLGDSNQPSFSITQRSISEFPAFVTESSGNALNQISVSGQNSHPYEDTVFLPEEFFPGFNPLRELPYSEPGDASFPSSGCSSMPHMPIPNAFSGEKSALVPPFEMGETGYGGSRPNSILKTLIPCDSIENLPPIIIDDFTELSHTLWDLTDEDLLLLDIVGNDTLDNPYLGETKLAVQEDFVGTSDVYPLEPKKIGPEYRNGVICCTLNTESEEIPSNDDVFLPFRFPSPIHSSGAHYTGYQVSSSVKGSTKQTSGALRKTNTNRKGPSKPSDNGGPQVRFDLLEITRHVGHRNASNSEFPLANSNKFSVEAVNRSTRNMGNGTNTVNKSSVTYTEKHRHIPDFSQSSRKSTSNKQTKPSRSLNVMFNNGSSSNESRPTKIISKPNDKSVPSDQEQPFFKGNFDVPYFSDVEAMIINMDLSPDPFDLPNHPEVKALQHEEAKRTIVRLEQGAHACTQRALALHDAFAVLHNRSSRHFIKKPEVLLGRETEEVKVDIDLGKEMNRCKISRRQAIIKLDNSGFFHLKNLGKCSIYVNGKEVVTGQSLCLASGCLIEIRELSYVFETNHKQVKQYVESMRKGKSPLGS